MQGSGGGIKPLLQTSFIGPSGSTGFVGVSGGLYSAGRGEANIHFPTSFNEQSGHLLQILSFTTIQQVFIIGRILGPREAFIAWDSGYMGSCILFYKALNSL